MPWWTARAALARRWPVFALLAGALVALGIVGLIVYSGVELARFDRAEARRATYVYAAGQPLSPGVNIRTSDLGGTLARLRYVEVHAPPDQPGRFRRMASGWDVYLHAHTVGEVHQDAQRVRIELSGDRITRVTRDGRNVGAIVLEPEVLTSATDTPGEDYHPVKLAEVPLSLINAVLAAEDHRFFDHGGVDLRGLLRAAWVNLRAGRVAQGGSTITQQLIKNRLLGAQRTFGRKMREAWLAALVDWRYSKQQILQAYLNEIYLGQRGALAVRGVGAAARIYFHKEVHQLTIGEAAVIAGMTRAPNAYSPVLNPDRARQRRDVVLAQMRDLGKLSPADYDRARAEPVRAFAAMPAGQRAPYFTDLVRQEVEERFGEASSVFTTLDGTLQRFAETAVSRGLERLEARRPRLRRDAPAERLQAALIALDPTTGQIRALVGGRDYGVSQYNRAVHARRQPGSAFKPFVYAAALTPHGGDRPSFTAATIVDDSPLSLTVDGKPWTPRNYEERYEGPVTVRHALEHSLNAATIRVAQAVGLRTVVDTAHTFGFGENLQPVPALALGAFEVTPLELVQAYAAFANGGVRPASATTVRSIQDEEGHIVTAAADEEPRRVMEPAQAYLMTSLLQGVITSGTAAAARNMGVTGDVAGKTGTTNDARDAWFVGYTPTLLTLVWVGFDDNQPHGLSGAEAAVPIWADFTRQAMETYPSPAFVVPEGITVAQIDATNGKLATRFCPVVAREVFLTGSEPGVCTEHGGITDQVTDWWKRFRDWMRR
jgi:penicillin-binding protein 1B